MDALHQHAAQDIDHRKKRRNRTTHSCINCHTTKRKCDRKRPCQRCTQLGLTGLCVYEVDDPASPDDPNVDEATRLRKRIAELEGVIRELKNKPHPRWISQAHDAPSSFHTRSQHSRAESFSKKRKLGPGADLVDLSILPDGGPSSSSSSVAVKLEPHQHDPDAFNVDAYDARYALPDAFAFSPSAYHSSSSPDHSDPSDSPRLHRAPRAVPASCECLSNTVAFHSLTGLEVHLRGAINVLANLTHSPRSESAPADPLAQCSLYAEIARLQDLIAASTRPTTPMLTQTPHGARVPLAVTVPVTFSDSIQSGLPPGFNLRPPPPPPRAPDSVPPSATDKHPPSALMTPPLTTPGYAWEAHAHAQPPPSPAAARGSPTLSSASSSLGSAHSFAPVPVPVPVVQDAGAYTPFFHHQSSHARFAPTPSTPVGEFDGFAIADPFHHAQAAQAFGVRAGAAGVY